MSDHTVSNLARILQRSRDSITALIKSGRLKAYDAAPEGRYRQWRVTPESLQEFRERNTSRPRPNRKVVRRPVKQFV